MEKQRAKAAERARRKVDREANPTGYIIEAYDPDEVDEVDEAAEPAAPEPEAVKPE